MSYDSSKYKPIAVGAKGDTGSAATMAVHSAWASSHHYYVNDLVPHAKSGHGNGQYVCILEHTSAATDEPEVGVNWATYWDEFLEGGEDGAGSGDVVGPASSVTSNIAGFYDTGGKQIKDLGTAAAVTTGALEGLTASTTATDGDVDKIAVKESGAWKFKTLDSVFKRKIRFWIPAQAWQPQSSTRGCGSATGTHEMSTNKFYITSCAYGYSAKTYANFLFGTPDAWDGGTIELQFVWHMGTATSGSVRWGGQIASVGDGENYDVTLSSAAEVTDSSTSASKRCLVSAKTSAITPGGTSPTGGELLEIVVYRDPTNGADNINEIVYLDGVYVWISVDQQSE